VSGMAIILFGYRAGSWSVWRGVAHVALENPE